MLNTGFKIFVVIVLLALLGMAIYNTWTASRLNRGIKVLKTGVDEIKTGLCDTSTDAGKVFAEVLGSLGKEGADLYKDYCGKTIPPISVN